MNPALQKERAARSAVDTVQSGQVLGLGTGSTVAHALQALAERIGQHQLDVRGVPTSLVTENECLRLGIPLTDLHEDPLLDLAIDGADQIDAEFHAIKGYGGALLREKIVARAARRLVLIIDEGKLSRRLNKPVPVEVLPFGAAVAERALRDLGGKPQLRRSTAGAYVSDNGNQIFDTDFGEINDPAALARQLIELPGVMDHGLFVGLAQEVHVGRSDGVEILKK